MIEAKISNKRSIRLVVGDVENIITAPLSKAEAINELLKELGASCICSYNYTLTKQQFAEFSSRSISILYC